ncbi:MAG: PEP-CTERM sorting domain-containing protein [Akkermansia sp.]|nr:PEP-CTERM sorting domain-containing protein [Akkermansia sp.]
MACETDKELVRNGTSTEVEFNPENKSIATLIGGENASSDSFTVKVTKATTTSHNVGTFVGLKDITLVTSAIIKSGANVTWTNGADATWSGESWKTAAGTIGTMADANVGNATFVGVANDDSTINDYTVTVDTAATAKSIAVSSGNYTFSGTGTLSITNEGVTNDGYSLNIAADASATFNVATTLAGTVSNAGTLTFGSNLTVEADTSLSLSGNIVLKDTIYNNGTLNLAEDTEISLDALQNFDIKTDGGSVHILNEVPDGEGNLTTNTNGNGFEYILSTKYWLVKGNGSIDGLLMGEENPLRHVNGTDTYQLAQDTSDQDGDGLGFYFDSGNYTLYDNYYIKSGDVEVGTAVQELVQTKASTYVMNGGTMKITEGTVNTSDIAYDSGNIKVAGGAKLNYDAEADGLSIVELLTGSVITYDADATPGTLLISMDGLDTGNVALTTSFKGTLELAAGTTFTLGCKSTGSDADAKDVNTKTITGFVLNSGSNLQYQGTGANAQFNNLTVQGSDGAATFKVLDTHATADDVVKLTGTTTLDNDLNLQFQYGGSISIESLAGTGKLSASRVGDSDEDFSTTISSLSNFEGEIEFSSTAKHTVVINTGNVGEGKSSISFSSLTASTGTGGSFTFNVQDNTSIGQLNVVSGLVTVSAGKILTLGGGTSEAPVTHSIGQLNAAEASVNLAAYTTLTLGGGTSEVPVTHSIGTVNAAGTTTIQLNDNAKLNKITKTGSGTIALKGSGVYDLGQVTSLGTGNNSIGNVVGVTVASLQDATAWTGTVRLHGTTEGAMLHNLGNSNSWVEVAEAGLTGKLHTNTNAGDVVPNIRLTGNLELNSTDEGDHNYKYIGDFAGAGKYIVSYTNEKTRKYEFAGNVAEWTGAFEQTETAANAITTVTFSGEAKDINTEISNAAGTLNLEIDTTEGAALSKNVNVTKLQVNNGKTATLSGESNSITAGSVTISRQNATMSNVTVQGSTISATNTTDGAKGSISNANVALAQLAEDASFTIQDMTLTNTTITAATVDTKVNLQNVEATNLALAQGKFTMNAAPTVGIGGTTANFGTNTDSSFMISKLTAGSASLTLNLDVMGAYESTGAVDNVTLTITLAGITGDVSSYGVDAWKALVGFEESSWLGQALVSQKAEYTVVTEQTEQAPATAGESGVPTVSYSVGNVGSLVITISGLNVPEPATSTLSLLALAALAARRRRKA